MVILPTYDEQKVSTLSLSPNSIWQPSVGEVSLPVSVFVTRPIKFDFDFSVSVDSERGLALAPRIPFTAVTNDLAGTGETSRVWNLTISTAETEWPPRFGGQDNPVTLYGTFLPNPNDLDADNPPPGHSYIIESVLDTDTDNWVLNSNGTTYDLVFDLDFTTTYTNTSSGASLPAALLTTVNNPLWNGRLIFSLAASTFWGATISSISFTGNVHNWHTGFMGVNTKLRGRSVHDYKTGQPYMSNLAVGDGYLDGIKVNPDNWDPADPTETNPFIPPPNEGVVDDELIDLE